MSTTSDPPPGSQIWPFSGGTLAELIRQHAWHQTSLGTISSWPEILKTAVNIVLCSPIPMTLLWGSEGILIYNEGYSVIAGGKHPAILGVSVVEAFPEAGDFNRQVITAGLQGRTLTFPDSQFILNRNGQAEEAIFDLQYSPVFNSDGVPQGTLAILTETTERKQIERRNSFLIRLDDATRPLLDPEEITRAVTRLLGQQLNANGCVYVEVDTETERGLVRPGQFNHNRAFTGSFPLASMGAALLQYFKNDKPFVFDDVASDPRMDEIRQPYRAAQIFAAICVPLQKAGKLSAVLSVMNSTPRKWSTSEIDLVISVTNRCWESIERSRVTQQLIDHDRRLQLANKAGRIGSFEWLISADSLRWTPAMEALFGLAPGTFEGTIADWQKRVDPRDASSLIHSIQESIADRATEYGREFRAILPDGTCRWFRTQAQFTLDASGLPVHMLGVIIDINEQHSATQQMKLLQTAVESVSDSVLITEPQLSFPGPRIIYVNPAFSRMTGYESNEILGKTPRILQGPRTDRALIGRLPADLLATKSFQGQTVNYRKDGSEYVVDWEITPMLDEAGQVSQWVAVQRDVTARVQDEEAIRDINRALIAANSDLKQFAYLASHDLQEPLRMVAIYSQLLQKRYAGQLDAQADLIITQCVKSAMRMQDLIADLLAYTQASNSAIQPASPIPLESALEAVLQNLHMTITEASATITHTALPALRVQAVHLQQVLQNLISNALKYRSTEPPRIEIASQRSTGEWIISVRDNGIGIEPAYKEQVFGLFKRLHSGDKYPGTGLGLAICKRLLENYGGYIWLESEPSQGTTFFFSLPAEERL